MGSNSWIIKDPLLTDLNDVAGAKIQNSGYSRIHINTFSPTCVGPKFQQSGQYSYSLVYINASACVGPVETDPIPTHLG